MNEIILLRKQITIKKSHHRMKMKDDERKPDF